MRNLETTRSLARHRFALMAIDWLCHDLWSLLLHHRYRQGGDPPSVDAVVASAERELSWLDAAADELRPVLRTYAAALVGGEEDDGALRDALARKISDLEDRIAALPGGVEKAKGVLLGLTDVGLHLCGVPNAPELEPPDQVALASGTPQARRRIGELTSLMLQSRKRLLDWLGEAAAL